MSLYRLTQAARATAATTLSHNLSKGSAVQFRTFLSIPAHPGLALGQIARKELVENVVMRGALQAKYKVLRTELNELFRSRREQYLLQREMIDLGIPVDDLDKATEKINDKIKSVAAELAAERISLTEGELDLAPAADSTTGEISSSIASPLDFSKSQFKDYPISFDSLELDAQYISFDSNDQSAANYLSKIKAFVSSNTKILGTERSTEITTSATTSANRQANNHQLQGTVIMSLSATHQMGTMISPAVYNVERMMQAYNFVNNLTGDDAISHETIASKPFKESDMENTLDILTGVTRGSSFIGMVHLIKTDSTVTSQDMNAVTASVQQTVAAGGWFAKAKGGFGVDVDIATDVKNLLSRQDVNVHCTVTCMGVIPTINSNEVQLGVQTFDKFDPKAMGEKLAMLNDQANEGQQSMASMAKAARTGQEMVSFENEKTKTVLTGLAEIDDGRNKVLDINSLMEAMESYVEKTKEPGAGVPLNYYLTKITGYEIQRRWVDKYFPREFLKAKFDENESGDGPSGGE